MTASSTGADTPLDIAAPPPGVEPSLWNDLAAELKRSISFAPRIELARVLDIELTWLPDGQVRASWEYNNPGDYDLNGVVNSSDLVPVALYYEVAEGMDRWPAARVADGDGNGVVNISDVTVIGAGFQNTVDGYYVLAGEESGSGQYAGAEPQDGEWVATAALADAEVPVGGGLPVFSTTFPRHPEYEHYWAAPVDLDINTAGGDHVGIYGEREVITTDMRGDWYMQYRDGRHSNISALPGPRNCFIKWQIEVPGSGASQPVYNSDGLIFVGGSDGLHAINPDGTRAWVFPTDLPVESTPAVGPNGAVYFGCNDGHLYAVGPDGELAWRLQGAGPITTGIAVADDGTVYTGFGGDLLAAVSPPGQILWTDDLGSPLIGSPTIDGEGRVYAACLESAVVALLADGTNAFAPEFAWYFSQFGLISEWAPAIADFPVIEESEPEDVNIIGEVLVTAQSQYYPYGNTKVYLLPVAALSSPYDYHADWAGLDNSTDLVAPPTMRPDFSMVFASGWKELRAVDQHGEQVWVINEGLGGSLDSPVTIDSEGRIYFAVRSRSQITSVTAGGEFLWQVEMTGDDLGQPVIGPDETLYLREVSGMLYAIGGTENNLPPPRPENLTAAPSQTDSIKLAWNTVPGAAYYEIFRDETTVPYMSVQAHAITAYDTDLEPGEIHTYWLRAVNAFGVSEFSEPVTASSQITTPTDFAASDATYPDRIVLTWNKVQNATGYLIKRDVNHNNTPPYAVLGDVAEWADMSITDWDEHTYYISATNGVVESGWLSDVGSKQRGLGDTGPGTWRQLGKNAAQTYLAEATGPGHEPEVGSALLDPVRFRHHYQAISSVYGSEGCQYLGAASFGIMALNVNGTLRWSYPSGTLAVVLDDGALAVAEADGLLILNSDGTLRIQESALPCSALTLQPDGDLILIQGATVTKYTPGAGVVWTYPLTEGFGTKWSNSALVADDGTVYIATAGQYSEEESMSPRQGSPGGDPPPLQDHLLIALNPEGEKLWQFTVFGEVQSKCIGADGSVVVSTTGEETWSIDPTGEANWMIELRGSLAVHLDGTLICKETWGRLLKLNPADGSTIWEFSPPDGTFMYAGPIVDAAGNIFLSLEYENPLGSEQYYAGALAISSAGALLWRKDLDDRDPTGLTLDEQGTLWLHTRTNVDGTTHMRRYWFR